MVPPETPRKRLRFLSILLAITVMMTSSTAHAATTTKKAAVKKAPVATSAAKKTTAKTVAKKSTATKKTTAKKNATTKKKTVTAKAKHTIRVKADSTIADEETTIALPPSDIQTPEIAIPVVTPTTQSAAVAVATITTTLRDGYWTQPIVGQLSQSIHDDNAVDIRAPIGTEVHAAAAGFVTLAKEGYNGGYGNYIIISHPNGTETLYAHLSKINVTVGQSVAQLQVIGLSGISGHVTGAHLHFEIHNAFNPWGNDPVGTNYTI